MLPLYTLVEKMPTFKWTKTTRTTYTMKSHKGEFGEGRVYADLITTT